MVHGYFDTDILFTNATMYCMQMVYPQTMRICVCGTGQQHLAIGLLLISSYNDLRKNYIYCCMDS